MKFEDEIKAQIKAETDAKELASLKHRISMLEYRIERLERGTKTPQRAAFGIGEPEYIEYDNKCEDHERISEAHRHGEPNPEENHGQ